MLVESSVSISLVLPSIFYILNKLNEKLDDVNIINKEYKKLVKLILKKIE